MQDKLKLTLCSGLPYGLKLDRMNGFKPILRSMEDLTNPITQDGETFVPIERLFPVDGEGTMLMWIQDVHAVFMSRYQTDEINDLLDKWHFNRRGLDPDDFIDVNRLDKNPYG